MFEDEAAKPEFPWARRAEQARRDHLQRRGAGWRVRNGRRPGDTLAGRILDQLTRHAVDLVRDTERDRDWELNDQFATADSLVNDLIYAGMSYDGAITRPTEPDFWHHALQPANEIKNKSYRLLSKELVEGAADAYLKQRLRAPLLDRTLVDMLLALELYQYAFEMLHPSKFSGMAARSPLKQLHPFWSMVREMLLLTGLFGGIGWAVSSAMDGGAIGSWGGWVVGVCAILWIIGCVWAVIILPFAWKRHAAMVKKVFEILEAMLHVYSHMQSSTMISAQQVLDTAKAASAKGVVWPSPLLVLLEDVIARDGRL